MKRSCSNPFAASASLGWSVRVVVRHVPRPLKVWIVVLEHSIRSRSKAGMAAVMGNAIGVPDRSERIVVLCASGTIVSVSSLVRGPLSVAGRSRLMI